MARAVQINPTRMELLQQKNRLRAAERAYNLLEDKRDKLIQEFFPLVKAVRALRHDMESRLEEVYRELDRARAHNSRKEIEGALSWPRAQVALKLTGYTIMKTPIFEPVLQGTIQSYGMLGTNWRLDRGLRTFWEFLPQLLELAQKEADVRRLAREIERTRRRVNALEYILLPQIRDTVKYVTMKLTDREQERTVSLMKMKQMTGG